ncbi:FAD-binding domain-containing protein [Xylariaceae sp. FL0594]|nr:FAD-binding domain-containing protein [Xylariaceae sp. FL0594]
MSLSIAQELKLRLSPDAAAFCPQDAQFPSLVSRWREWHAPTVAAIVQVVTERDIQESVRFANEKNMPFFVRSGGHGATEALGLAKDALQIDVRKMSYVRVAEDGKSATIGGGASAKQVVDALEAVGKRTVTGICENVGISALTLGGGHGWLQGEYGLAADQVLSARLVLASGEAVTVSDGSHPDLFWALRGAGHNFGIVAAWEYRVYDANPRAPKWAYEIFIFSGDKLEALFTLHNEMQKTQPAHAIHWGYFIRVEQIDPGHMSWLTLALRHVSCVPPSSPEGGSSPIIWYGIIYDGPESEARAYAQPLHNIDALTMQSGTATTHELAALTFQDVDGPGCAYGLTSLRYPIGLQTFCVSALSQVYDHIDASFRATPEIAGSFFLLERYPVQAVQAVDEKTTAFPHRGDNILLTSYVQYKPDPRVDALADAYGRELQRILLAASGDPDRLRAYVNYAHGDEDLRAVYGWEGWRLSKLRQLKTEWDPENRMGFYVPIV